MDEVFDRRLTPATTVASNLIWPTLDALQTMRRNDQITRLAYNYATRLMRSITDQLQLRYDQRDSPATSAAWSSAVRKSPKSSPASSRQTSWKPTATRSTSPAAGISNDEIVTQLGELQASIS